MPKQDQQQQPLITKRRVTIPALWEHLGVIVKYKKFYHECFLALQQSFHAPGKLEVVAKPIFDLCQERLYDKDRQQLCYDIVLYRSDDSVDLTDIVIPAHGNHETIEDTCTRAGVEADPVDAQVIAKNDRQVLSNRHRPWYQGYSQGFIDVCCTSLELMMMMPSNSTKSIIITASKKRGTILALHEHLETLQQHLQVVLKHISNNLILDHYRHNRDNGNCNGASLDVLANGSIHGDLLLKPLQSFLTPSAYQVIHSILVSYDATKHQDIILLGYSRGAIDACTFVLKWTQLVVNHIQKIKSNKTARTSSSRAGALLKPGANWGVKRLLKYKIPVSSLPPPPFTDTAAATSSMEEDAKPAAATATDMADTQATFLPPSNNNNLRHPGSQLLDGSPIRTPFNSPTWRRVSCDGMGKEQEREKKIYSNQASSTSSSLVDNIPLLQFTTRFTVLDGILAKYYVAKHTAATDGNSQVKRPPLTGNKRKQKMPPSRVPHPDQTRASTRLKAKRVKRTYKSN